MLPQAQRSSRAVVLAVKAPRSRLSRLRCFGHGRVTFPRVGKGMDARGRSQDMRVISHGVVHLFI